MMDGDITQYLKDTENSLRDFIAFVLQKALGRNWEEKSGVTPERILKWNERKDDERKRQVGGVVEERLIYYADFYDIPTILKKHWNHFTAALGDWKTIETFLGELEKLRDPDAHRRELLPHQKYLAAGIAGEIRTRLVRFRSKQEASDDYFPRIESVRDNFGNIWVPDSEELKGETFLTRSFRWRETNTLLRPDDVLEFVITASDPLGEKLSYMLYHPHQGDLIPWQDNHEMVLRITKHLIQKECFLCPMIKSSRDYHAHRGYDDIAAFKYVVLPPKI
jgi:hypothetical protein